MTRPKLEQTQTYRRAYTLVKMLEEPDSSEAMRRFASDQLELIPPAIRARARLNYERRQQQQPPRPKREAWCFVMVDDDDHLMFLHGSGTMSEDIQIAGEVLHRQIAFNDLLLHIHHHHRTDYNTAWKAANSAYWTGKFRER